MFGLCLEYLLSLCLFVIDRVFSERGSGRLQQLLPRVQSRGLCTWGVLATAGQRGAQVRVEVTGVLTAAFDLSLQFLHRQTSCTQQKSMLGNQRLFQKTICNYLNRTYAKSSTIAIFYGKILHA